MWWTDRRVFIKDEIQRKNCFKGVIMVRGKKVSLTAGDPKTQKDGGERMAAIISSVIKTKRGIRVNFFAPSFYFCRVVWLGPKEEFGKQTA